MILFVGGYDRVIIVLVKFYCLKCLWFYFFIVMFCVCCELVWEMVWVCVVYKYVFFGFGVVFDSM